MTKLSLLIPALYLLFSSAFGQGSCANGTMSSSVPPPTKLRILSASCSTLVVQWQGSVNQTYCVSIIYFNPATNKKDTVAGGNIVCDGSQSCTATIPVVGGIQGTWKVHAISNGNVSYPAISILENPVAGCGGSGFSVCGKVMLQGAYDAGMKIMRNSLNSSGILQAQASNQPYSTQPFNYPGTESVGTGFFAAHPDIVDWVLVELRDANVPLTVVVTRAAFVKQDGTLVDTGGTNTQIIFPGVASGKYHVAIRHRNHLGIRTLTPVDFGCGTNCYDFTTAGYKSFQNQIYTSPVQIGVVWVMRGGDANANTEAKYQGPDNDRAAILTDLGSNALNILKGYYRSDITMDGFVKYQGPDNDRGFILSPVLLSDQLAVRKQQLGQ
ncbi:MAG: hypothetical protein JWQ09_43 [Segetibacter sp.]|nr:hypothetical protein [Segetibacter sp.]